MTHKRPPKSPAKPFNLGAKGAEKTPQVTRDKDNAQPRVKPPEQARKPGPRLAPPGMSGTKRNLPTKAQVTRQVPKRFSLGQPGELKKEFKPIVSKPPGKGPDISR